MSFATIDGITLKQMIISAANNLSNKKVMVDDLNVFPVPDGDTGTNMSLTVNAVKTALENSDEDTVSAIAEIAANASLRGARGNSGVILSQIFRGFSKGLKGLDVADGDSIKLALNSAKETAYRAVMKPQEGTVLTVARQICEGIEDYTFEENTDLVEFLETVVVVGNKSLDSTTEMLPALKQANVVDAGGKGLMTLLEGALYFLKNGVVVGTQEEKVEFVTEDKYVPLEDIKFGYCTELIIKKDELKAPWKKLRKKLEYIGDCVIVIDDSDIIKVHVHSNNPGIVLEESLKLGEIVDIKIDNLKEQSRAMVKEEPKEYVENAFITVATGEGIVQVFEELGCNSIIQGGQTMNPSTEDFVKEIDCLNAGNIYVFPNNKNIILAAEQAKNISEKNVIVVPTKTIVQGISALLAFDEDVDAQENADAMLSAAQSIKSGSVTFAARDCDIDDLHVEKDDIMGLLEGKICTASKDVFKTTLEVVDLMVDDDVTSVSLYRGEEVSEQDADTLVAALEEKYASSDIDFTVYNGGQPLYYYYISAE
ncbi:MAG: DAK2 domain-containing protein [Clostridia bacterium]|nr:DAK2 domain-containing protein [Clostridia bacterium]